MRFHCPLPDLSVVPSVIKWPRWGRRLLPALALFSNTAMADATVTFLYEERPPYLVVSNGQLEGLAGAPAMAAFRRAAIPVALSNLPFRRQLMTIQIGGKPVCMVAYENAERQTYAKFTDTIFQDGATVVLALAKNSDINGQERLTSLFGRRNLRLLLKDRRSYGAPIDTLINELQPSRFLVSGEHASIIKMIAYGRGDYMFMSTDEFTSAVQASGVPPENFKSVSLADVLPVESRKIMCSKSVPDEAIAKLNDAIREINAHRKEAAR